MENKVYKKNNEYYITINYIDYSFYGIMYRPDTNEYFCMIGSTFFREKNKDKIASDKGIESVIEKMTNNKLFFLDDDIFFKLPFEFKFIDKTPIPVKVGFVYQKIDNSTFQELYDYIQDIE